MYFQVLILVNLDFIEWINRLEQRQTNRFPFKLAMPMKLKLNLIFSLSFSV